MNNQIIWTNLQLTIFLSQNLFFIENGGGGGQAWRLFYITLIVPRNKMQNNFFDICSINYTE